MDARRGRRYTLPTTTPPGYVPPSTGPVEGLYMGRHPTLFEAEPPPLVLRPPLWKRLCCAACGLLLALVALYVYYGLTAPDLPVRIGFPDGYLDRAGFTNLVVLLGGAGIGWCAAPERRLR